MPKCFVSTDPGERDLYLSNVLRWDRKAKMFVHDEKVDGLLLTPDSIVRIEFLHDVREKPGVIKRLLIHFFQQRERM